MLGLSNFCWEVYTVYHWKVRSCAVAVPWE